MAVFHVRHLTASIWDNTQVVCRVGGSIYGVANNFFWETLVHQARWQSTGLKIITRSGFDNAS